MTRLDIAALACRIMALALACFGWVQICGGTAGLFGDTAYRPDDWVWTNFPIVGGLGWFLVGAVLWFRATVYARRMVDDDPTLLFETGVSARDVLTLAMQVAGLWIALPAFIELLSWGVEYMIGTVNAARPVDMDDQALANLLRLAARFAGGAVLAIWGRALAGAWMRGRDSSLAAPPAAAEPRLAASTDDATEPTP